MEIASLSLYIPGDSVHTTLQSAVNAAALNPKGSVWIPASYGGTDTYTNASNVPVLDMRSGGSWNLTGPNILAVSNINNIVVVDGVRYSQTSAGIQAALNALPSAGGTVFLPKKSDGTAYVMTNQVTYTIAPSGGFVYGVNIIGDNGTVLDNQVASNSMILINSTTSNDFLTNASVQNVEIKTTTNPTASNGIEFKRVWIGSIENCYIHGLTGDSIRISDAGAGGDPDSTQWIHVTKSHLDGNGGWGVNLNATSGTAAVGGVWLEKNIITNNTLGGCRVSAVRHTAFRNNQIATNSGPGIHYQYNGASTNIGSLVDGGEFDTNGLTGNHTGHIQIDTGFGMTFKNIEFDFSVVSGKHAEYAIKFGDGTHAVQGCEASHNYLRCNDTATPFVGFNCSVSTDHIDIRNNIFDRALAAGQYKYANASSPIYQNFFFDNGEVTSGDVLGATQSYWRLNDSAGNVTELRSPDATHGTRLTQITSTQPMAFNNAGPGDFALQIGGVNWLYHVNSTNISQLLGGGTTAGYSDSGATKKWQLNNATGELAVASPFRDTALTATMGLTLKKGSGGGDYSSGIDTAYHVVDGTNLAFTVTIPTGWKLWAVACGAITTATGLATATVAIADGGSIVVPEVRAQVSTAASVMPFSISAVIAGDGASHTLDLRFKTSNASDAVTIANGSATLAPTMTFLLMPSN